MAKKKKKKTKKSFNQFSAEALESKGLVRRTKLKKLSSKLQKKIGKIWDLIDQRNFFEAEHQLNRHFKDYFDCEEVIKAALGIYTETLALDKVLHFAKKHFALKPHDLKVHCMLADSYMTSDFQALALNEYQGILSNKGLDSLLEKHVSKKVEILEPAVIKRAKKCFGDLQNAQSLLISFDLQRFELHERNYEKALEIGEKLINAAPGYIPSYNNSILAAYQLGDFDLIEDYLEKIFAIDPKNIFAQSFKLRTDFLFSRELIRPDIFTEPSKYYLHKQLECLLFFEDYQQIVDLYNAYDEDMGIYISDRVQACQIASFAHFKLGDWKAARKVWENLVKQQPTQGDIRHNIDIIKRLEEGESIGPHVFNEAEIIPDVIKDRIPFLLDDNFDPALLFKEFPYAKRLILLILKFADFWSASIAKNIIFLSKEEPELIEELKNLAQGPRFSDDYRREILSHLVERKYLPEQVKCWVEGKETEIEIFKQEIIFGNRDDLSDEVIDLLTKYDRLMKQEKFQEARVYCEQAIELAPDHPTPYNNLAISYQAQGDIKTADEIMEDVLERFPDYLIGKIGVVNRLMRQEKFDEAREILSDLHNRRSLHVGEFVSLQTASLRLAMFEGDFERADHIIEQIKSCGIEEFDWEFIKTCDDILDANVDDLDANW